MIWQTIFNQIYADPLHSDPDSSPCTFSNEGPSPPQLWVIFAGTTASSVTITSPTVMSIRDDKVVVRFNMVSTVAVGDIIYARVFHVAFGQSSWVPVAAIVIQSLRPVVTPSSQLTNWNTPSITINGEGFGVDANSLQVYLTGGDKSSPFDSPTTQVHTWARGVRVLVIRSGLGLGLHLG